MRKIDGLVLKSKIYMFKSSFLIEILFNVPLYKYVVSFYPFKRVEFNLGIKSE